MKFKYYLPLAVCFAWCSCVTFAQYDKKALASKEPGNEEFITYKDGRTVSGKKLKHRNYDPFDGHLVRVTNKDNAFNIDGKNYNDSLVVAFQDAKAFHKSDGGRFLIRLVSGKMNLYYFDDIRMEYTAGVSGYHTKRTSTYFFEKEKDQIVQIGLAGLRDAVKDNRKALNRLSENYPKDNYKRELNIEKLVEVVRLYNQ